MSNVMIDLETMDTGSNAAILSIGAVMFDQESVDTANSFYTVVSLDSCVEIGMTVSEKTKAWWARQSPQAKSIFTCDSLSIREALPLLTYWFPQNAKVYGNGAAFDNVVLSNAYERVGLNPPWKFYNDRCYRTLVAGKAKRQQLGTHHNALDDAISQAQHLIEVNKEMVGS